MFGLFNKESEKEKLEKKYAKAMKEWHRLSVINRKASDEAYAKAQSISERIEALKSNEI